MVVCICVLCLCLCFVCVCVCVCVFVCVFVCVMCCVCSLLLFVCRNEIKYCLFYCYLSCTMAKKIKMHQHITVSYFLGLRITVQEVLNIDALFKCGSKRSLGSYTRFFFALIGLC